MRKTSAGTGPGPGNHFQPRILQTLSVDQQTGYFVCPSRHVNHSPSGNAPSYQQKSKIGFVSRLIRRKAVNLLVVGCWQCWLREEKSGDSWMMDGSWLLVAGGVDAAACPFFTWYIYSCLLSSMLYSVQTLSSTD